MNYPDGTLARLGDRVKLANGQRGEIVISVDTAEYADSFPKADWDVLTQGVLVQADNGALIAIDTNKDEDIRPV